MDFIIIVYIFFGILPSLTWLLYYLRKDMHPEPKLMILKVFIWGAVITVPVFFVQIGLAYLLGLTAFGPTITPIIYWFLVIAFSEEFFKYLVVRMKVFNSPNLDEPLDIMLYMVVAALGFAALENILYLFSPVGNMSFNQLIDKAVVVTLIRFVGATFLHTLSSATIGYTLALSFYDTTKKYIYWILGIIMATLLHGIYDFSIMTLDGYAKLIVPSVIIIVLAIFIFIAFDQLRKMESVCKIELKTPKK